MTAADALAVFDFYYGHEKQMLYGLKEMPVELLIYVVDNTATVDEMEWAAAKYAGTANVGGLFFTIKYDFAYLEGKSPKKLDVAGFSLTNILKCGGVLHRPGLFLHHGGQVDWRADGDCDRVVS